MIESKHATAAPPPTHSALDALRVHLARTTSDLTLSGDLALAHYLAFTPESTALEIRALGSTLTLVYPRGTFSVRNVSPRFQGALQEYLLSLRPPSVSAR